MPAGCIRRTCPELVEGLVMGETTRFGSELIVLLLLVKTKAETVRINSVAPRMAINNLEFQ